MKFTFNKAVVDINNIEGRISDKRNGYIQVKFVLPMVIDFNGYRFSRTQLLFVSCYVFLYPTHIKVIFYVPHAEKDDFRKCFENHFNKEQEAVVFLDNVENKEINLVSILSDYANKMYNDYLKTGVNPIRSIAYNPLWYCGKGARDIYHYHEISLH